MIRLTADQLYYQHRVLCFRRPLWPLGEFSLTKTKHNRQEIESTSGFSCSHLFRLLARGVELTAGSGALWSGLLTWPHGLFNKLFSLSFSLMPWRSAFEYYVQVFPCVHTLEDGAQVAHPIIFPESQVFRFFYCFNCHDSENPSRGSSGCLHFVTWSATPHFVAFFSFASDLWFLQHGWRVATGWR